MKTQLLIAAIASGLCATAAHADAKGGPRGERPDLATLDVDVDGQLTIAELTDALNAPRALLRPTPIAMAGWMRTSWPHGPKTISPTAPRK